jgi:sialic acid synthase SpsE
MKKNYFYLGKKKIGKDSPVYFIADLASNHDGSLSRAKKLIRLAAKAGANAAKFQNFTGETLVSEKGFSKVGKIDHQSEWKGSVYEEYNKCSVPLSWTKDLKSECKNNNIEYFTSPYSLRFIEDLKKYVNVWKIGSGEITWHEAISKMSSQKKPIILATGASTLNEVKLAINIIKKKTKNIVLMQCNTNYTGSIDNLKYINLNVLKLYKKIFPETILGLSDHTPGHTTVLGSIALGAKVIEKHFTDSNDRNGPDHKFSLNPKDWEEMVDKSRELEQALGNGVKKVENNEKKTVIVQRRSIRAKKSLAKGKILTTKDFVFLRPCTKNGIPPYKYRLFLGKKLKKIIKEQDEFTYKHI